MFAFFLGLDFHEIRLGLRFQNTDKEILKTFYKISKIMEIILNQCQRGIELKIFAQAKFENFAQAI